MKRLIALLMVCIMLFPASAFAQPSYALSFGSQSDAVVALQYALFLNGYLEEKFVTGYYGKLTSKAVGEFQRTCGLEADGIAGEATLTLLLGSDYYLLFNPDEQSAAESEEIAPVIFVSSQGLSVSDGTDAREVGVQVQITADGVYLSEPLVMGVKNDFVKLAQERLVALGYLKIAETTRYFGEMTESALKKFQLVNGLAVDGILGNATATLLMSNSALPNTGAPSSTHLSSGNPLSGTYASSGAVSGVNTGSIVALAMEQLGKPYRYACRGTDAFDCSGLVYYVFKNHGITLPTSSSAQSQYQNAARIGSIAELKVGDVVFFNTGNRSVTINHCGIYVGDGQFIHASSGGGKVQLNSITSEFYSGAFRWALRILG